MKPVRFTVDDANAAGDGHFNCGPAALCAVADLLPDQALAALHGFDQKHYTNPSMMAMALHELKIPFERVYEFAKKPYEHEIGYPKFGLVRIQWAGPWTNPGVPMRVRYRYTHWVAWENEASAVFDVNAMCVGGWIPRKEWETQLVPWLLKEACPKASGEWWPTHCWEIGVAA